MNATEQINRIRVELETGELRRALAAHYIDDSIVADIICIIDVATADRIHRPTQELLGRMVKASYR